MYLRIYLALLIMHTPLSGGLSPVTSCTFDSLFHAPLCTSGRHTRSRKQLRHTSRLWYLP